MTRFPGLPYLFAALEQFRYIVFITFLIYASTYPNVQFYRALFCSISSAEHATPPAFTACAGPNCTSFSINVSIASIDTFIENDVQFGPAQAVNAGGVACSALEMEQNNAR